jgi:hypothetical protein
MAVKDMYIVHLKPDQTKSVLERIDEDELVGVTHRR